MLNIQAKMLICKIIRKQSFSFDENMIGLDVVEDENGLVRVKTKLLNRQDEYGFRYTILLPTNHPIVHNSS